MDLWHWITRAKLRGQERQSESLNPADIDRARSVLFAVFARYGDSVIAFKAINRFIALYPDKRYLLITTHQARPYAEALIRSPLQLFSVNKRRDPLQMWRLVRLLRHDAPDLGLNPKSHGKESEYFISFCRQFVFYRASTSVDPRESIYRPVYSYLQLPEPPAAAPMPPPARAQRIVICPYSTAIRRSLDPDDLAKVVLAARKRFGAPEIIVAGLPGEMAHIENLAVAQFTLGKSRLASERFIGLLATADLFIGVDTGPLHLAEALGLPVIAVFGPTARQTILDRDSRAMVLRHPRMEGVVCDILACANPLCIHQLCADLVLDLPVPVNFSQQLRLENKHCAMVTSGSRKIDETRVQAI
jgi:ADP-heptose:LPS heptosyltransferase